MNQELEKQLEALTEQWSEVVTAIYRASLADQNTARAIVFLNAKEVALMCVASLQSVADTLAQVGLRDQAWALQDAADDLKTQLDDWQSPEGR